MSKLLLKRNKYLKLFFVLFCVVFSKINYAQINAYAISTIPIALKKNANVIKREATIEFEVKEIGKAVLKVSNVITLINENAKHELDFYQFTNKFLSLDQVKIEVIDADGITRKKYFKDDLTKQASGDGLVSDGKIYFITIPANEYPITLKISYEIKYKGILNYPAYEIQAANEAIEKSTFTVKVPMELDLRYKQKNTTIFPTITTEGKIKIYTWSVQNLPAFLYEAGSVSRASRYPQIILAPNKFKLDDYEGDMSTWQSFGNWYRSLAKEASNLTDERKLFFRNLVKEAKTDREKTKIIYTYLQNNFRYVLILLGIGGFKPVEANFVDKKKYGDCKALSNYIQACLNAVGIKSYQALINADYNQEPVDPNFPISHFNHVIICVPQPKDSIWLECTSTTNDFATLGNFTENRNALLITENGGKLVPTPTSKAENNILNSNTTIQFNTDGSGKAVINKIATGEYKQDFIHNILSQKKDDQKTYLLEHFGYVEPTDFTLDCTKEGTLKLTIETDKLYDFTVGKKVFLHPRLYKIWTGILPTAENRTKDFYFEHPLIKIDTTTYNLTNEVRVETLPKNKVFIFAFGSFTSSYQYIEQQKKIIIITKLVLTQHKIPVANYLETKLFFDKVLDEYTDKIVLKKL